MDRFSTWRGALLLLTCAALSGCGRGQGEVSGTVRCDGKPLPFGTIQFLGADGVPRAGQIQADGTFTVQLPAGQAKVIVSCIEGPRPSSGGAAPGIRSDRAALLASAMTVSRIPQRYADWNASGLTVVVQHGKTVQDFALTTR